MAAFDFPNHTMTTLFPKGDSFKFGRGYEFASKPQLPLQRKFQLHFNAVRWYFNSNGTIDLTTDPANNAGRLCAFYEAHMTYTVFTYAHPQYGTLNARFSSDDVFQIPKTREGGSGVTDSFTITVVEQPL